MRTNLSFFESKTSNVVTCQLFCLLRFLHVCIHVTLSAW